MKAESNRNDNRDERTIEFVRENSVFNVFFSYFLQIECKFECYNKLFYLT